MQSTAQSLCSSVKGSKRAAQLSRIVNAGTLLGKGLVTKGAARKLEVV